MVGKARGVFSGPVFVFMNSVPSIYIGDNNTN